MTDSFLHYSQVDDFEKTKNVPSVILNEAKNLVYSRHCQTLRFAQGDAISFLRVRQG